jgi:hypothetical protein
MVQMLVDHEVADYNKLRAVFDPAIDFRHTDVGERSVAGVDRVAQVHGFVKEDATGALRPLDQSAFHAGLRSPFS